MVMVMVLLLLIYQEIATNVMTGSPEDIVATNVGIKVERIGKISFTGEYVITSILIKLPNLTIPVTFGFDEASDYKAMVCTTLMSIPEKERNNTLENYRAINAAARERVRTYLNSRTTILNRYIIPLEASNATMQFDMSKENSLSHDIRKRQTILFSLLGGGAMMALGGVTEYQIHQIKNHVRENSDKIDQLKKEILLQKSAIKNLGESVFGFVKNTSKIILSNMEKMACATFLIDYRETLFKYVDQSISEIDNVLWTALSGSNNLLLTPRMLEVNMLKVIVEKHSLLANTIYKNIPGMLYSVAKLSLIEIDKNFNTAHFTLQIPILQGGIMALFKTSQVGTYISENFCTYYNLPKYLYKWHGIFHPIEIEMCMKNNNFYICPRETLSNETACIQDADMTCPSVRRQCSQAREYRLSVVGILIRNNIERDTFKIITDGLTVPVVMGNSRTAYIDWKDVNYVQIGKTIINSPNTNIATFTSSNFSIKTPVLELYLDDKNVTKIFNSICRKYNETLDQIIPPLIDHWRSQNLFGSIWNLIWHVVTTLSVLMIIGWLIHFRLMISNVNQILHHGSNTELSVGRRYSI